MAETVACVQCLCERRISVTGLAQHLRLHHIGQKCVWKCGQCEYECEELSTLLEHCIMLMHDPKTACRSDMVDKQLVNLVLVIQRRNKGEVQDALVDLVPSNTPSSGSDSNETAQPTSRRKRSANPSLSNSNNTRPNTLSAAIRKLRADQDEEEVENNNKNPSPVMAMQPFNPMDLFTNNQHANSSEIANALAEVTSVHSSFWTGETPTAIPVDTEHARDQVPILTVAPTSPSPSPTPYGRAYDDNSLSGLSLLRDDRHDESSFMDGDGSRPKVTCSLCGISLNAYDWKGLLLRERLRNHALCAHFPKKAWKCALCPLVSKVKSEVARHSRRVHLKNSVPILQMPQEEYQRTLNHTLNTCFPELISAKGTNKKGVNSSNINNNSMSLQSFFDEDMKNEIL